MSRLGPTVNKTEINNKFKNMNSGDVLFSFRTRLGFKLGSFLLKTNKVNLKLAEATTIPANISER